MRARIGVREQTCWLWVPTYRPMEAGPNVAREGAVPSSCQVIELCWPAVRDEVATGLVILRKDEVEVADNIEKYAQKRSPGQEEQPRQGKELEGRRALFFLRKRTSGRGEREWGALRATGLQWMVQRDEERKKGRRDPYFYFYTRCRHFQGRTRPLRAASETDAGTAPSARVRRF
jgi:hypothetical protein